MRGRARLECYIWCRGRRHCSSCDVAAVKVGVLAIRRAIVLELFRVGITILCLCIWMKVKSSLFGYLRGATSIQEEMFNWSKRSSDRVKEKVHFSIQFHATQVPHSACDRLAVFLIPLDTGRVSSKTCKVPVQNGQCHWPRVSETAKLILDTRTQKYDEKLYKLVMGKGSRSGVVGEVITNLTEHISAACPTSVALPLRFCYAGTVLHVTIQCLRQKPGSRPSEWQRSIFEQEGLVLHEARTPLNQYQSGLHQSRSKKKARTMFQKYKCLQSPLQFNIGRQSSGSSSAMDEASRLQVPRSHNEKTKSPILYLSLSAPATPAQNHGYLRSFEPFITSSPLSSSTGSFYKSPAQNGINADFEDLPWKSYAQKLQAGIETQEEHFANARLTWDIEQSSFLADSELEDFKLLKQDNEHYRLIIEEVKEELAFEERANAKLIIELEKLRDSNMELHSAVKDLEDSLKKMRIKQAQHVDSMEEERDAYLLESCVFENLVQELCGQLQTVHKVREEDNIKLQGTQTQNECKQSQDFICYKDLGASFSDIWKAKLVSEDQIRELQSTCNLLEDRMMKEHGELMATISSLDAEFGNLSRESDRMLSKCNDIEMLLSKIEHEQNGQQIQGSLRLSIEEKACEIVYLRDEVQRLKEQTTTLLEENRSLASKGLVETERHHAEEKESYNKIIEMELMLKQSETEISTEVQEMASQCRASETKETSLMLDVVSRERAEKDEAEGFLIWKTEKQKLLDELLRKSAEVEILKTEVVNFMETLKNEKIRLDVGLQKLNAEGQEQIAALEQKASTLEAELENCKILKATLEEQVICLKTKLQVECLLGAEARNDCKQLRKENQDLKCQLLESNSAKGNDRSKLDGELLNLQTRMEVELDSWSRDKIAALRNDGVLGGGI